MHMFLLNDNVFIVIDKRPQKWTRQGGVVHISSSIINSMKTFYKQQIANSETKVVEIKMCAEAIHHSEDIQEHSE